MTKGNLICDGCGQTASPEHLAARFRRLEWATRFRPLHIQTLLVGAVMPANDAEYIYADAEEFSGEASAVLRVAGVLRDAGIDGAGKSAEVLHHELQRTGVFLVHVLECPLEPRLEADGGLAQLLAKRAPSTLRRIRRSLKPKRVALVGAALDSELGSFTAETLGCDVVLDRGSAFKWDGTVESVETLHAALSLPARQPAEAAGASRQ
ncbi:MAG: hypothetical protein ABSG69_06615 [Candidatus Acidiferrum sp.]|jgi:hypothetical protein